MGKIILQPVGHPNVYNHFRHTIIRQVDLNEIIRFVADNDAKILQRLYPKGKCSIWGIKNGQNDINKNKWYRVRNGDIVLFFVRGGTMSQSVVTYKINSKKLAEYLWGTDSDNETWENIYFLDSIKNKWIDYFEFNKAAEYEPSFVVRNFNVLDDHTSAKIIMRLKLEV